ncbi:MAG TPA: aryl-sulfate sulfotransferase [Polyangia bacterium]|nr:aryl-sulfate sulfotransferase [Polyangia bacterium]
MRHQSTLSVVCGCLLLAGLGCAASPGGGGGEGGSSASGGSTGSGGSGSGSGGSTGNGGSSSGGSTGSGGSASGGSTGSGGNVSTGGTIGSGGAKGGSSGSGGTTGTGGAKGGSTGSGGSSSGGSTGSGGSSSGGTTGSGGSSSTSCTITPTASTSTKIGTVGIVTFTTTLSSPTSAQIDFGLDTTYGMTAPVNLSTSMYRTLLLGMKPSKMYHYRVSVTNASGTCTGGDNTIMTGAQPNGTLPTLMPTTQNASAVYKGFVVTGEYIQSGGAPAYIFDSDGAFVWWYNDGSDACGPRMSYDAQYMWIASANVPDNTATDHVHRVTMDGLTDTDFTTSFAHHSHQVTPLPDGSVAFYTYGTGSNGCDDIRVLPANATPGTVPPVLVNSRTAHGGTGACHLNNIEYSPTDDALIFSDLDNSCLTKIDRKTGTTIWVLNGGSPSGVMSTFTGDSYKGGEHGFQVVSVNDILLFNNNTGSSGGSQAIEFKLDTSAKTSTKIWSYQPSSAISVMVLGDVERLPNGNTIVNFGTGNTIQEVTSAGTMVQQIKSNSAFGFFEKRATLYGPSTK